MKRRRIWMWGAAALLLVACGGNASRKNSAETGTAPAEAVEEIIHSKSEISQEKALDRLSGKLRDSLAAVKTRLSRARGKLKNTLKGEYGGAGTV